MRIYLNELHPRQKLTPSFRLLILRTLKAFIKAESLPGAEISVILTEDRHLESLNDKYRNKKQPTDVLSFPYQEENFFSHKNKSGENFLLGEIYISMDQVVEQARNDKVSVASRTVFLLIHGLYHLLGYDHGSPEAFKEMENLVNNLYKKALNFNR